MKSVHAGKSVVGLYISLFPVPSSTASNRNLDVIKIISGDDLKILPGEELVDRLRVIKQQLGTEEASTDA